MSNWYEDAIFYHIYPLGFCGAPKENTGEPVAYRLDKVLELIPHLQEMRIGAVYFGPVFASVSHGYDTTDYKTIDPRLGDNASFRRICEALHAAGIRVVLDGVFNHVGRQFPQFLDIQANGSASPYCGWFENLNFGGQSPYGDAFWYEGWNGCFNLVKLNLRNPAVCDHLEDAVGYWMDEFGIDGIRFDAADCINPDFFRRIRSFCKSRRPDFWLMGEIIHGDYTRWANPEMLDTVTNYECYKGIYSSHNDKNYFEINYSINRQSGNGGIYKNFALYNFVDNHDVTRLASILRNPADQQNVYTLLYTMPGIPSLYYGSEYGITGNKSDGDDALRPCFDLETMQQGNPALYQHIVRLGTLYQAYPALRTGQYETIQIRNEQVLYRKTLDGASLYVALNLADGAFDFRFPTEQTSLTDVLSGQAIPVANGEACATVPPHSGMILAAVPAKAAPQQPDVPVAEPEAPTEPEVPVIGGRYRHFKGQEYRVLAVAKHSETLEPMVIYQALYGDGQVWARPLGMFLDTVDGAPRFALLDKA